MGPQLSSSRASDGPAGDAIFRPAASASERERHLEDLIVALAEANSQLQRALDSRVVIEQAKGVLAERFGLEMPVAFELLRRSARNNRMPLRKLATLVVESEETPVEIGAPKPTIVHSRS